MSFSKQIEKLFLFNSCEISAVFSAPKSLLLAPARTLNDFLKLTSAIRVRFSVFIESSKAGAWASRIRIFLIFAPDFAGN